MADGFLLEVRHPAKRIRCDVQKCAVIYGQICALPGGHAPGSVLYTRLLMLPSLPTCSASRSCTQCQKSQIRGPCRVREHVAVQAADVLLSLTTSSASRCCNNFVHAQQSNMSATASLQQERRAHEPQQQHWSLSRQGRPRPFSCALLSPLRKSVTA